MNPDIKWAARLAGVREVSVLGSADLGYWTDRLAVYDLVPAALVGQAHVMIIAADATSKGVRFRELSDSVHIPTPGGPPGETGAFLVGAFNSSRFFAFVERNVFGTPYAHGHVHVSASAPTSIRLEKNGVTAFRADMARTSSGVKREPSSNGPGGWDGPVFLPARRERGARDGKVFFAHIAGVTRTYSFRDGEDAFLIQSRETGDAIHELGESGFTPAEWEVRDDATHAKSKTYRRHQFGGYAPSRATPAIAGRGNPATSQP